MPRWRARSEKREYEPTHARAAQRRLAVAIIATVAILVIAAGVIYIMLRYPNGFIHKSAAAPASATCLYEYDKVTVYVTGINGPSDGSGCSAIFQPLVNYTDGVWHSVPAASGEEFAKLGYGAETARIYDAGNRPLAGKVADWFQNEKWRPEVTD